MNRIARNSIAFGLSVSFCAALARAQTPPSSTQAPPSGTQTPPASTQTPPASNQTPPSSTQAPPTSLKWYAELAKSRGWTSIGNPTIGEDEPIRPLKELILQSLIVDGEVLSSTVDASDGFEIYTWYRVRVLSRGPEPSWVGVVNGGDVPEYLPRPNDGEILVRLHGGTVVVDGITITQDDKPQLTIGSRYLFFLEPLRDGAFVPTYQSWPVELNDNGIINHASHSKFAQRFDRFQTLQDLLGYAK